MKKKSLLIILAILLIWNIVLTILVLQDKGIGPTITEENVYGISTDLTKVVQDNYSSVVEVKSSYGIQTGFIYKQDKNTSYIVTAYHGIGKDNIVSVTLANNKTLSASVLGFDYLNDVAVLSIESPYVLNVVKCGDNEYTKNGEFIICIGSPNKKDSINKIELGIISNNIINVNDTIMLDKKSYSVQKEMISFSSDLDQGYSGSPIFNMKNEMIGMVQMSNEKQTFALTINEIKIISDKIINNETTKKINIGIKGKYIKNLEDYERNMLNISLDVINGYYVEEVTLNSLASKLGIQPNDVVISINNLQIASQKDLLNFEYSDAKQDITVLVNRGDKQIELKGTIND